MTTDETKDTKFKPGQSGNPRGKPAGARNKIAVALEALGEADAEAIVKVMIEKAKGGDAIAARPILDRVWPVRKGARVQFDLPSIATAQELPDAIASIAQQVAEGTISPDEGALIAGLLETQRKAIETSDLATRLAAIEERLAIK